MPLLKRVYEYLDELLTPLDKSPVGMPKDDPYVAFAALVVFLLTFAIGVGFCAKANNHSPTDNRDTSGYTQP